jgi:hypothetical protein
MRAAVAASLADEFERGLAILMAAWGLRYRRDERPASFAHPGLLDAHRSRSHGEGDE